MSQFPGPSSDALKACIFGIFSRVNGEGDSISDNVFILVSRVLR